MYNGTCISKCKNVYSVGAMRLINQVQGCIIRLVTCFSYSRCAPLHGKCRLLR